MGFVRKKKPPAPIEARATPKAVEDKFVYLLRNLALFKKQYHVDAVCNMQNQFKKNGISDDQVGYLDLLVQIAADAGGK